MMKAYIDTNVPASQYEYSSSLIKFLSPSGITLTSGAATAFYKKRGHYFEKSEITTIFANRI